MSFSNPINFPENADDGDTYEFESRVYNFQKASGLPGYWELTNPGSLGSAGGAEITSARVDGGGNNNRYIGPAGLAESGYLNEVVYSSRDNNGVKEANFSLAKGEPIVFTRDLQAIYNTQADPLNGLRSTAQAGGIDLLMLRAQADGTMGATTLSNSIVDEEQNVASTSFATNQARRRGSESCYMKTQSRSASREGYFRAKPNSTSTSGFMLSWGYHSMSTSAHTAYVYMNGDLTYSSGQGGLNAIFLQAYSPNNNQFNLLTVQSSSAQSFKYYSGGGCAGFYWLTMGIGVGMSKADNPYSINTPDGDVN